MLHPTQQSVVFKSICMQNYSLNYARHQKYHWCLTSEGLYTYTSMIAINGNLKHCHLNSFFGFDGFSTLIRVYRFRLKLLAQSRLLCSCLTGYKKPLGWHRYLCTCSRAFIAFEAICTQGQVLPRTVLACRISKHGPRHPLRSL